MTGQQILCGECEDEGRMCRGCRGCREELEEFEFKQAHDGLTVRQVWEKLRREARYRVEPDCDYQEMLGLKRERVWALQDYLGERAGKCLMRVAPVWGEMYPQVQALKRKLRLLYRVRVGYDNEVARERVRAELSRLGWR